VTQKPKKNTNLVSASDKEDLQLCTNTDIVIFWKNTIAPTTKCLFKGYLLHIGCRSPTPVSGLMVGVLLIQLYLWGATTCYNNCQNNGRPEMTAA